ncbi:MAG TPA: right-handed parallel beta-helix repeat-containing protein [Casimicrobiaceae bacterium]|jgi:hypothetical protein|nr:right-handed parallel beta-helix repeat-containing protein [Casimicrobiaceae bacterium]
MKRSKGVMVCAMLVAVASFATGAWAQASRTWVSGVGDDANPCSRTAPCKTFAGAISKTAAGGEINALDPGGFGAVTITKSITITGDGTIAGIAAGGVNGIVVQVAASDVVILRRLHINGARTGINGIRMLGAGDLHVEDCEIHGFTQQGIDVAPTGDSSLFVSGTTLRDNTGGAIYVRPSAPGLVRGTLDRVSMQGNGRGLRVEDGASLVVTRSTAAGNGFNGFVALASSRAAELTITDSVSSSNGAVGVYSGTLSSVRVADTMITGNNVGFQAAGGAIVSSGGNTVTGNATNGAPTQTIGRM